MKHQDGQSPNGSFEQLRILSSWQGLTPCLFSWIAIFVSITAAEQWPSVYPLAILVIANRIFALFLLSHEAVHVLLTPHRALNDFVGRYLCAFPIGVSFQQWRSKHLLHHRFLGSGLDLDLPIYSELFRTWPSFLRLFFSGKVSLILLIYFTPLDHILNRFGFKIPYLSALANLTENDRQVIGFGKNDFLGYFLFHSVVAACIVSQGAAWSFFLYWIIPHLFVQFYFPIWSHLQHGAIFNDPQFDRRSRSISSPLWLMPFIMPVNVRFHLEHHLYPFIPHYRLASVAKRVENDPVYRDRHESLTSALHSRK